jgi:hypothetical protein
MAKSQRRPYRGSKLNNISKIKIEDPESMMRKNNSEDSLYSGSDIRTYDDDLYSRDSHSARHEDKSAINSLIQNHLNKPTISPKRTKSFYKKKIYTKASKPPLKPHWRHNSGTYNKGSKAIQYPSRTKVNTVSNSTRKTPSLI